MLDSRGCMCATVRIGDSGPASAPSTARAPARQASPRIGRHAQNGSAPWTGLWPRPEPVSGSGKRGLHPHPPREGREVVGELRTGASSSFPIVSHWDREVKCPPSRIFRTSADTKTSRKTGVHPGRAPACAGSGCLRLIAATGYYPCSRYSPHKAP